MPSLESVERVVDAILAGRKATPGVSIVVYGSGGARALVEPLDKRQLIADFYDVDNRVAFWQALSALPTVEAILREAAEGWRCERLIPCPDADCPVAWTGHAQPCGVCDPCLMLAQVKRLNCEPEQAAEANKTTMRCECCGEQVHAAYEHKAVDAAGDSDFTCEPPPIIYRRRKTDALGSRS